jgi:hypothetical protein
MRQDAARCRMYLRNHCRPIPRWTWLVAQHRVMLACQITFRAPFDEIRRRAPDQPLAVLFDIGANDDHSCLEYARVLPEAILHAFQPVVQAYMRLSANAAGHPRIRLHNLALGEANGIMRMATSGHLLHEPRGHGRRAG